MKGADVLYLLPGPYLALNPKTCPVDWTADGGLSLVKRGNKTVNVSKTTERNGVISVVCCHYKKSFSSGRQRSCMQYYSAQFALPKENLIEDSLESDRGENALKKNHVFEEHLS